MRDFEERIIWSSQIIPLLSSFHRSKLHHSLWLVQKATTSNGATNKTIEALPSCSSQHFYFRRIWQGKCSQYAAKKVFLATDVDGVPIICFLLLDQKMLLAIRLEIDEVNGESVDIRPQMSWSIPAIAAAAVTVTRPKVKVGPLPFKDIVVLAAENDLLLYSGKQCLCRYYLPFCQGNDLISLGELRTGAMRLGCELEITGVEDAVDGRINVVTNSGQIFRCSLTQYPGSSLANDCISAMSEGLCFTSYAKFSALLWGENIPNCSSKSHCTIDSAWDSFAADILAICGTCRDIHGTKPSNQQSEMPGTSWDFLVTSKFHKLYQGKSLEWKLPVSEIIHPRSSESIASFQTGESRDVSCYDILNETLDALHALYESLKLDNLRRHDIVDLVSLLCTIAATLGEASFLDYYLRDFPYMKAENFSSPSAVAPRTPPCLYQWLEDCLLKGCHFPNAKNLPPLVCKDNIHAVSWARKIVSFYSLLLGAERKGRELSTGVYCALANGSARTAEEITVLAMVGERFGRQQLDILPIGVSIPLRHALDKCRECPPTDWPAAAYALIGREDLAIARLGPLIKDHETQSSLNLLAISVPYMLHLKPVSVPSSFDDAKKVDSTKLEDTESLHRHLEDGMEHIFNSSTQLRYGRDLRLNEVRRLLCSARPVAIQTTTNPSSSDQDIQQHQLWNLAQRTTSLPFGRGAFTLATTYTLLTEALVVPKLVLAGRLPTQQNATVNLDPNVRSITELKSWPEFHNGVAAGLRLAPFEGKMSRTWIQYNKPEEPNFTHAGLLFAFGLHQHLRALTLTDIYRYLAQEHDITTIGLLLGLAASHRGTMHPAIAKILSLHIPSRLPSSYTEVELPTILQSAALVSIGLLYEESTHPVTMKILLDEICRKSGGDNVLEREGYVLAAGYALGLVALGRGKEAFSYVDTAVDRLFQYIGEKGVHDDKYLLAAKSTDDTIRNVGQMMDGTQINIDVTAPGATIALALIFLKTESEEIAHRLHLPITHFDLQYIRPDFIMLRVIARNLILWSRLQPFRECVEYQIPEIIKHGILRLENGTVEGEEFDAEAIIQAYVNIVAGACISIGLKYAGSKSEDARELLYTYAIYFLNEIKHIPVTSANGLPKGLVKYVDRGTLEICLHLIVLSLSLVMAGSGHLQIFRLLRYLRYRNSSEGHINYGMQMAVSLATGFLFLGGGMQTFFTGNSAIAALLITLYPRLPTGPNDNRCHLQAFRHLYVIAAESRWIQTIDVDTGLPVYCPVEVTIKETEHYAETSLYQVTPCILPERPLLKCVSICGPRYWPQVIQLTPDDKAWWKSGDKTNPFHGGVLYIKRRVGSCSYVDDPVGSQSLLSRAMHRVCDTSELSHPDTGCKTKSKPGLYKIDQLVSTFSADPSLIAFAQLCCESSWKGRSDASFQEFCSQVLFECVSKDRPSLLQVYLSLFTMIEHMREQVKTERIIFEDSISLSSFKVVLAYNEAVTHGKLACSNGGIIQCTFIESLRKHIEDLFTCSQSISQNVVNYLEFGNRPTDNSKTTKVDAMVLSWYLIWYGIPCHNDIKSAIEKIKGKVTVPFSVIPLLRILLPSARSKGLSDIDNLYFFKKV